MDVCTCHDAGLLQENSALQVFLHDCFTAMLNGRRQRQLSATSKLFYSTLMRTGGQMITSWVSKTFHGPSASTIRAYNANIDFPYILGLDSSFFDHAATLISEWELKDAPFMLSEDGSALQMRIDITVREGLVHVFGLSGCSFTVTTLEELRAAARTRPLASTLYAYTLVPLVEGAPHFPLFAFAHDNSNATSDTLLAWKIWRYIWQVTL